MAALVEFAAGAGHEINNPLAVISGRAQLFLRHEPNPERRRELAVINGQARRVHEMIADLMLFARPPQPRLAECDMGCLIDRIVAELAPRAAQQGVELSFAGGRDLPALEADATQLEVALCAVCENALDALESGGRVEISAALQDAPTARHVAITIRDDGPGMSPEVRRHAFDPFFSGSGAGRGLGFGLSKCWRIVREHGGRVDIDSGQAAPRSRFFCPPS